MCAEFTWRDLHLIQIKCRKGHRQPTDDQTTTKRRPTCPGNISSNHSLDVYRPSQALKKYVHLRSTPEHNLRNMPIGISWRFLLYVTGAAHSTATCDSEPMLGKCWASVVDGGPTFIQHWFNVMCLLRRWSNIYTALVQCRVFTGHLHSRLGWGQLMYDCRWTEIFYKTRKYQKLLSHTTLISYLKSFIFEYYFNFSWVCTKSVIFTTVLSCSLIHKLLLIY